MGPGAGLFVGGLSSAAGAADRSKQAPSKSPKAKAIKIIFCDIAASPRTPRIDRPRQEIRPGRQILAESLSRSGRMCKRQGSNGGVLRSLFRGENRFEKSRADKHALQSVYPF
jgi:hypothetical protein